MQTTYTNADNGLSSSTPIVVPTTVNGSGNQINEGLPSPFLLLLPASKTTTKPNHQSSDQAAYALVGPSITSFSNSGDHEQNPRSRLRRESSSDRQTVNGAAAVDDNDDLATAASYFFRPLFVYHIQESHRKKVVSERPQSAEN